MSSIFSLRHIDNYRIDVDQYQGQLALASTAPTEIVRETVRRRYAERALTVLTDEGDGGACCSGASCGDPVTSNLYTVAETELLSEDAVKASLGCGNPTALASLAP